MSATIAQVLRAIAGHQVNPAGQDVAITEIDWVDAVAVCARLDALGVSVVSRNLEVADIAARDGSVQIQTFSPVSVAMILLANETYALDALLPAGLAPWHAKGKAVPKELCGKLGVLGRPWYPEMDMRYALTGRAVTAFDAAPFGVNPAPVDTAADILATLLGDAADWGDADWSWSVVTKAAKWLTGHMDTLEVARGLAAEPDRAVALPRTHRPADLPARRGRS